MMYFHKSSCISPQGNLESLEKSEDNWLVAKEPSYENIPRGVLRRMGKAVRIGVGAALPLIEKEPNLGGIILGTANGGMEDCIRFLNQIIEYDEGNLTPTNFVQSTTNAIAGQIGLMATNTAYNATHVHRGLAFENALLDASFISAENPEQRILVGGVDEISTYNYNIDFLAGWYKKEELDNTQLYRSKIEGSLAGEGSAMFVVSLSAENAVMKLEALRTIHSTDFADLNTIIDELKSSYKITTILSGENGDSRITPFYENIESSLPDASVWRYKHLSGEYPTSTSFALWLAMKAFEEGEVSSLIDVKRGDKALPERQSCILIYNSYHGNQHGFMVVSEV